MNTLPYNFQNINIFMKCCFNPALQHIRGKKLNVPKLRHPIWFVPKERVKYEENLTSENRHFIKEIVHEKLGPPAVIGGVSTYAQDPLSVLKHEPMVRGEWKPGTRRAGLICRKIGVYPLWFKDGSKKLTTLLQVVDNHVIKYTPPEEYIPTRTPTRKYKNAGKYGCLLIGAESADPQTFTKEYCGLFKDSGVAPKKLLGRFLITPESVIQPGTPLTANHFRVGDVLDVKGFTKYRGFQGVMKRWGFKGQPASHGATKTHRRPGNIGGGGEKGRVWPGTKLPGHMGNDFNIQLGVKIWRINTKYNVLFVSGTAIPGSTNSVVYVYDTRLPLKWLKESPPFPTYYEGENNSETELPEDIFHESVHQFSEPTIEYPPEPVTKKK